MGQCFNCFENYNASKASLNNPQEPQTRRVQFNNKSLSTNSRTMDSYMGNTGLQNEGNYTSSEITLDHFQIMKVIGRGSFGKVYLVRKKDTGELFAMKSLKKDVILRKNQK